MRISSTRTRAINPFAGQGDRLRTFARSGFRFFKFYPAPDYPPTPDILSSGSSMHPSELTPIFLKPSSTSSSKPFFLAHLPRILAWSLAGFILVNWFSWVGAYGRDVLKRPHPPNTEPFILPNYISHNLGPYTPWYPLRRYKSPPKQCEVTQVNLLHRHGSRFPTAGLDKNIRLALSKIQAIGKYRSSKLDFLGDYKYGLKTSDLLPYGASESHLSGSTVFERYSHLATTTPFLRVSGSNRVVDTAGNWTSGYESASKTKLPPFWVVPEDEGKVNNTIWNNQCPNATHDLSDEMVAKWVSTFAPPIVQRLNGLAPGANLTQDDIQPLMSICSFETLANQKTSPWCWVFKSKEYSQYEYWSDLEKYYFTGYGHPLGPVQGVGYVNELIARLTGTAVRDNTQTNHTITSDPELFPLNRTIYADFTHDNEMAAIYSALGLFDDRKDQSYSAPIMDPTEPHKRRSWVTSRLTPFASRMVVERLQCRQEYSESKTRVRVLVNDAVVPLPFCGDSGDGICDLEAFVQSQVYARETGIADWYKCFKGTKG